MFSKYFLEAQNLLLKTYAKAPKKETAAAPKAPAPKSKKAPRKDFSVLVDVFNQITASSILITPSKVADISGYVADSPDLIAVRNTLTGAAAIFEEAFPAELVAGTFHIIEEINRKQLTDGLVRAAHSKKLDHFAESTEPLFIPSFAIAFKTTYSLAELKEAMIDIYEQDSVDPMFELDIAMVLGQGLVIRNWREGGRSYVALETGEDTLKWFFLLMNEYLDAKPARELDLRQYVRETRHYNEF